MNKAWWAWVLVVPLTGCPDDGGGSGGTGSTSDGEETVAPSTSVDSTVGDSTGDPTGGPSSGLEPCDPTTPDSCAQGVCSGAPQAGFYCRPACSDMAEPGTDCGFDDVCLPVGAGNDGLACFDVFDCDLVTGQGCDLAAGESCVAVSLEPLRTACVPSGSGGLGDGCDPLFMHDCGPGFACLGSDIDGGDLGQCTPLCIPGDPLPDGCSQCTALNPEIGTCAECTALDDQCPDGQQCQPVNEFLGGICVDHGPLGPGDPCAPGDPTMACQAGHLCLEIDVDDVFVCVETCDRDAPMCANDLTCVDVAAFLPGVDTGQLGLCIDTNEQYCDPDARPSGCSPGDTCLEVDVGVGICGSPCDPTMAGVDCAANQICLPEVDGMINLDPFLEGNGACGVGCTSDVECGGGTCLLTDGLGTDGVCGDTCTPGMPGACPAGSTCVATPADPMVGACIAGGAGCDPTMTGQCPAPTSACVALDGGGTGTCMLACNVQDPMACGGLGTCNVKTDALWHGGVCLGGGEPCDPIAQDCGPGQTCGVVGGGPIGGNALLCDDAGMVAEGGSCAADDNSCAEGLYCLADTCVATCDPAAGACAMGVCTDISASFYLPAGTVGACL